MVKLYTVVVTYNGMNRNWIDRCLSSLQNSSVESVVVVVDNNSSDETCKHITSVYPDVVLFPQTKNLGFGQANNIGIKYAMDHDADYVFLLNQDASVHPEALRRMMEQSDGKSLITPMQLNGDGTKLDIMFGYIVRSMQNSLLDDVLADGGTIQTYYECGCIAAASWLLPREIINNIGGFNPLFFHYGEDNNYHQRIEYHGYKTIVVPSAYMYHDREEHGNKKFYSRTQLKRELLLEVCDINKTFSSHAKYVLKTLLWCYLYYLPKGRYVPGRMAKEILSILFSWNKITKARKKDKARGRNWL